MIKAIWPSFAHMRNHLPPSANITSSGQWFKQSLPPQRQYYSTLQCETGLLSYFIYWLIQFPFLLVSPKKIRWLFIVKSLIVPPTFIAIMIWAFVKTGGGPLFSQKSRLSGSAQSWAWLSALNSALGNYAVSISASQHFILILRSSGQTLAVNIPDFTRYARRPSE